MKALKGRVYLGLSLPIMLIRTSKSILNRTPNTEITSMTCEFDPSRRRIFLPLSHRRLHTLHVYEGVCVLSKFDLPTLRSLRMSYAHTCSQVPTSLLGLITRGLKVLSFHSPFLICITPESQADFGLNAKINPDVVPGLNTLAIGFMNVVPLFTFVAVFF
ncbi:hypothetical protein EDD18DRAFT_1186103 [Armillaria luteobubalina]|uniref:Uncharacterized protein n=1 Tax=Armillaria luteobubalina TaxID=153913 RepID=A0AA39PW96_9AGAR|nr:hypothetical protein EDD18DRAFT_1186103 [Armillaria luteobubalina]